MDGKLRKLGPEGIDLESEDYTKDHTKDYTKDHIKVVKPPSAGRIAQSPAGDGIEIHYADGTKLVVTPAWWDSQKKWYLNVSVDETTASKGIMGRVVDGWLPALSTGDSLGPRPAELHDRYVQLYKTFADSWRVTRYTSLFDYAPGTSTKKIHEPRLAKGGPFILRH